MRKVVFYPFIPAMVNIVEEWLQTKSQQGLLLVRRRGWIFVFEEKQAKDTRYFMYFILDASIGFSTEYYYAKQRYGKGKSTLNNSYDSVFEVDPKNVDNDFEKYITARNEYYKKRYIKLLICSIICSLGSLVVCCHYPLFVYVFIFYCLINLYAIASYVIIVKGIKKRQRSRQGDR